MLKANDHASSGRCRLNKCEVMFSKLHQAHPEPALHLLQHLNPFSYAVIRRVSTLIEDHGLAYDWCINILPIGRRLTLLPVNPLETFIQSYLLQWVHTFSFWSPMWIAPTTLAFQAPYSTNWTTQDNRVAQLDPSTFWEDYAQSCKL